MGHFGHTYLPMSYVFYTMPITLVRFLLRYLPTPKSDVLNECSQRHFEINWPLVSIKSCPTNFENGSPGLKLISPPNNHFHPVLIIVISHIWSNKNYAVFEVFELFQIFTKKHDFNRNIFNSFHWIYSQILKKPRLFLSKWFKLTTYSKFFLNKEIHIWNLNYNMYVNVKYKSVKIYQIQLRNFTRLFTLGKLDMIRQQYSSVNKKKASKIGSLEFFSYMYYLTSIFLNILTMSRVLKTWNTEGYEKNTYKYMFIVYILIKKIK